MRLDKLTTAFQQADVAAKSVEGQDREVLEKSLGEIGAAGAQIAASIPDLDAAKAGGAKLQHRAERRLARHLFGCHESGGTGCEAGDA